MSKIIRPASPALILPDRWMRQPCQQQQSRFGMGFVGGATGFNIADYFNTTTYTGTGGSGQTITTGINLAANVGAIMLGTNGAQYPYLFDTLRGAGKYLSVGVSNTQTTAATSLSSFNSNGFTLGSGLPDGASSAQVGWSWRKHPKLFNVISFAGTGSERVVPHGLDVAPGLVIIKAIDGSFNAYCWHKTLGSTPGDAIEWGPSSITSSGSNVFANSGAGRNPDATNVYLGSSVVVNGSGNNYVMYVFADDPTGYISAGSYIGNGSSSGPSVNLGWEPQWLLIKQRDASTNWWVFDNARGFASGGGKPFQNVAYNTGLPIAVTSTGFQPTSSDSNYNGASQVYLYMAIRKP